jgi:FlaA1/EpsC-like NDP-sugar epimerase
MNRIRKSLLYFLLDIIASFGVWMLFFLLRRYIFEASTFSYSDEKAILQLRNAGIIAGYWVILYGIGGLYSDPFRKSRLRELLQVFQATGIGVLVLFFTIFLDDPKPLTTSWRFYFIYFLLAIFGRFRFSLSCFYEYQFADQTPKNRIFNADNWLRPHSFQALE